MTATAHRRVAWVCMALAIVGLTAPLGCGRSLAEPFAAANPDDPAPRRGGMLRVASFQDIRNLDPAGPSDGLTLQPQHLLFAGLVDLDEHGQVVPELAERWQIEDEGRTVRFFLRTGVLMHDGAELTADDVKRSVERALHPSTPNPNAAYFEGISGFRAFAEGKAEHLAGVTADGPHVVAFHLDAPDATFLPMMAMHTLRPVCRSAGDRYDDAWLPCGAGPFMLRPGDWRHGTSLRLTRFEGYFRPGLPYLDAVEWAWNAPQLAQRFRFESGELDVFRELTQSDQTRFAADARWRPFGHALGDIRAYGELMNTRMPPFDNVEVRRAVAAAIDWEHVRLLKPGYITVSTQPIPPDVPGHDPDLACQRHDVAAALEHMRRAGYPFDPETGRGGYPEPIVYPVYENGLLMLTAQLVQQELAKIGLRLDLRLVSWQAFLTIQSRRDGAAMSQANWEMDYPDPSSFFDPLFTTAAIPPAGYNSAFYSNARVDDLLARAHREFDPRRRRELYREAGEILCDEAPWAFGYSYHEYYVHQPYVRGFAAHPVWPLDVLRVFLDRAGPALAQRLAPPGSARP
ncbi:MAG: ABC transporter substrate-binding protein [Polyangiaceae bacterium]|nr:ABC transporter substrate-binding protein [Polyangiaceae bacterium]